MSRWRQWGEAFFARTSRRGTRIAVRRSRRLAAETLESRAMLTVPSAADDYFETPQDTALTIAAADLVANDTGGNGDSLQVALALGSGPFNGKLALDASGNLLYTPDRGYYSIPSSFLGSGDDSFSYFAWDGTKFSDKPATVSIRVVPRVPDSTVIICSCNLGPIMNPPSVGFMPGPHVSSDPSAPFAKIDYYTTAEDTRLTIDAPGVFNNDSSGDGSPLAAALESEPQHGTVTVNADGSFSYLSSQDYFGQDYFVYRLTNGTAFFDLGTVSLNITPVNDPPVVNDDHFSTEAGLPLRIRVADSLANDRDVEHDRLTLVMPPGNAPQQGTLTLHGTDVVYTPKLGYQGNDGFAYVATDGQDFSASAATVLISLTAPIRHNARLAADVNNDLRVSAIDVLLIINCLNSMGPESVSRAANYSRDLLDVNGDGQIAPGDALSVINALNSHVLGGEGESGAAQASDLADSPDLFALLALDMGEDVSRRRFGP
jgi:hypothetical protein